MLPLGLAAFIKLAYNLAHQLDQAAGLLEIGVFFKPGVQLLDGRVKGIGVPDAQKQLVSCLIGQPHLIGTGQRVLILYSDIVYRGGVALRKFFK
ncbi:MAG: hypothetical protein BWY65_01942 [Firmicutes bacterium ADurb.Bin373]|nr:MAG: hypothetical protein BWY65_01942 [Firmicutes bacterium ADurb.Bin373]